MNLTFFTLWGIKNHSRLEWRDCEYYEEKKCFLKLKKNYVCENSGKHSVGFYKTFNQQLTLPDYNREPWSFEAYTVALSDEIAQRHHDVEDSFYMDILDRDTILDKIKECFGLLLQGENETNYGNAANSNNKQYFIPLISRFIVHLYNQDLIDTSYSNLKRLKTKYDIKSREDFIKYYPDIDEKDYQETICFSETLKAADRRFKKFIKNAILNSFYAQRMDGKGLFVIRQLFKAYLTNPKQLHDSTIVSVYNLFQDKSESIHDISKSDIGKYREEIGKPSNRTNPRFQVSLLRAICDHISGMTDNFVLSEYERLYGGSMKL